MNNDETTSPGTLPPATDPVPVISLSPKEAADLVLEQIDEKLKPIRVSLHELRSSEQLILFRLEEKKKADEKLLEIATRLLATVQDLEHSEQRLKALEAWRIEIDAWRKKLESSEQ